MKITGIHFIIFITVLIAVNAHAAKIHVKRVSNSSSLVSPPSVNSSSTTTNISQVASTLESKSFQQVLKKAKKEASDDQTTERRKLGKLAYILPETRIQGEVTPTKLTDGEVDVVARHALLSPVEDVHISQQGSVKPYDLRKEAQRAPQSLQELAYRLGDRASAPLQNSKAFAPSQAEIYKKISRQANKLLKKANMA